MAALHQGCKAIEKFAKQDNPPHSNIAGQLMTLEAAVKACFVEFVMRRLNQVTYDTGKELVHAARQKLV
jgi:hypothetical protein